MATGSGEGIAPGSEVVVEIMQEQFPGMGVMIKVFLLCWVNRIKN